MIALSTCLSGRLSSADTVNEWVELVRRDASGYVYSAMTYVPSRRQVLHWGVVGSRATPRNDVQALDVDRKAWVSDDPPADPKMLTRGVWNRGRGSILPCGTPAPSSIVHGVCWDSRRERLVFVMKGLMATYDPAMRRWSEIPTKTELRGTWAIWPDMPYAFYERGLRPEHDFGGERIDGPPPVYGPSVCYDPENDEILLFPHWGWQNPDLRDVTGRLSGHAGTFVYSFDDNLWRRRTLQLGSEKLRRSRRSTIESMRRVSDELDAQWTRGEKLDAALLRELRGLESKLAGPLRVEPPPRAGAPMVYARALRSIVLFGGQSGLVRSDRDARDARPGALHDTWLYDVDRREWREVRCRHRPPSQRLPLLVYDEESKRVLLVTIEESTITLWGFDGSDWQRLFDRPWKRGTQGASDWWCAALDSPRRLLFLDNGGATFACRLDLSNLTPTPALEQEPPERIEPQRVPDDDPDWLAALRRLPANRWFHPRPPREAESRDWGTLAYDPVRGWVCYFGGGHSTYQVNDVAIYSVGANRWSHGVGDHNDWIPPIRWDGCAMGFRGGPPAGHQRNTYAAFDGRVYTFVGHSRRWDAEVAMQPGRRYCWFFDTDRGGVWRQLEMKVRLGEGVTGSFARPHMSDASGRILGFAGSLEPYDGRVVGDEAYFSVFEPRTSTLSVRRIPDPKPGAVLETRPFCYLPDRDQVFFYEYRKGRGHATWIYDVRTNRFRDLEPPALPPEGPRTVVYVEDQKSVFAVIGNGEQWIYSLDRNAWKKLPMVSDAATGFTRPYAQSVYAARYGVLVNVGSASKGVAVMRPVFDRLFD